MKSKLMRRTNRTPDSWRDFDQRQQPAYPNTKLLSEVLDTLHSLPPIVNYREIEDFKQRLAKVEEGRTFIIQAGDCAESFIDANIDSVFSRCQLLSRVAENYEKLIDNEIITIGRIAGQYSKPRSNEFETIEGIQMPSYRGDLINDSSLCRSNRIYNPIRLLQGYKAARDSHNYIRDFHKNYNSTIRSFQKIWTSHEGLHLEYERSHFAKSNENNAWYNLSSHLQWIGARTLFKDSAHVELFSGIHNPIAVKVGPSISAKDLISVLKKLNPRNEKGKLILITRFGKESVLDHLPLLVKTVNSESLNVIWMCDPMHGNTFLNENKTKTRSVCAITDEIEQTILILRKHNKHLGGIHLETTPDEVSECCSIYSEGNEINKSNRYITKCDPRLNADQFFDVMEKVALYRQEHGKQIKSIA